MESRWRAFRRFVADTLAWRGRISRKGFYGSIGLLYLVTILGFPIAMVIVVMFGPAALGWASPLPWASAALSLATVAFLFGAFVRRLHDRNRPSWWLLVFFGPHIACALALSQIPETDQKTLMLGFIGACFIAAPFLAWGLVELLLLAGSTGQNRFGPDPRAAPTPHPT
jgi:uncharacterized membrane protein YhaH (DUF805 family)